MAEKGSLAFIPITICPEANSKVKCKSENPLATEGTRSKSELSLTAFPLLYSKARLSASAVCRVCS
jgi:hypothetical protein